MIKRKHKNFIITEGSIKFANKDFKFEIEKPKVEIPNTKEIKNDSKEK